MRAKSNSPSPAQRQVQPGWQKAISYQFSSWYQPGKTPAEAWQDYNQCKTSAMKSADPYDLGQMGVGGFSAQQVNDRLNAGMRGQGYVPTSRTNVLNAENFPPK